MPRKGLLPWLALSLQSSSPRAIAQALEAAGGEPESALNRLAGRDAGTCLARAGSLAVKLRRQGLAWVALEEDSYPPPLKEIADPPPVLFIRGGWRPDDDPAVAIVGSRKATPYGLAVARYLGRELGEAGIPVISGLARGIDAAAHVGALQPVAGRAVAVLGHGPDRVYPGEHRDLARDIASRGALLTEFPPGIGPRPWNFPRRNRLICGLARAVVVVEAVPDSGSLITAGLALDQGREVFAVPGPITAATSRGTNDLIRAGARPVGSALDIVRDFPVAFQEAVTRRLAGRRQEPPPGLSGAEREAWEQLDAAQPRGVDELAASTGLRPAELVAALLGLEIRGLVRALPGPRYVRGDWTGTG